MNTTHTTKTLAAALLVTALCPAVAAAAEPASKTTEIAPERYYEAHVVERVRTGAKANAVFSAAPAAITHGADVVFEARSVSGSTEEVRWRCVAREDVSECLGQPLSLAYRTGDDKVTLTVLVVPERAGTLIAQAD